MGWRNRLIGRRRHPPCRRHRGRRRLFWRVYLQGVLLLVVVGITLAVAGRAMWSHTPWPERAASFIASDLRPHIGEPAMLQAKLDALHESFDLDIAVYRDDGTLVASAGSPPPPLDRSPQERSIRSRSGSHAFTVPIVSDDGASIYLVAESRFEGSGAFALVVVFVVLVLLAVLSFPLARTITRPVERLTATAKALGDGDLSARTGLRRNDEVGMLARAFDDMAERLQRLVRNERELLANISHELRTPMARIRIALELVEEGGDTAASAEHIRGISEDLTELEALIEGVLATARLDRGDGGALSLDLAQVDVADVVAQAASRFASSHRQHQLETSVAEELLLTADPRLLRRALDNLLDNAAKYAEPGAGAVEIAASRSPEDEISIEVRDRGIGVDESDLDQLFEPFFRTDRSRARRTGGVGLGLALCRRIADAHSGRIEAERREGGGLCVRLTFNADPS